MKSVGERLLSNQSPFLVQKLLDNFGKLEEVKKLRSGDFLIKVDNVKMSRKLELLKNLGEFKVEVEPHKTLNYVKGVISHPDLAKSDREEVIKHLKPVGVTDAYCVSKMIDGERRKTGHIILTFRLPERPKELKAGFLLCTVYPYIPNPMRCYRCQKFGHLSGFCKVKDAICGICGEGGHEATDCTKTPCCVNCGEEHPSNSRDCPVWKAEKDIQKIKIDRNLPYTEAKKVYELEKSHSQPYAVVATAANDAGNDMIKQIMAKLISLEKRFQQLAPSQVTLPSTPPVTPITKTNADDKHERKRSPSRSPSASSAKRVQTEHFQNGNSKIPQNPNLKINKEKLLLKQKEVKERIEQANKNKSKTNRNRNKSPKGDPPRRFAKTNF